MRKSGESRQLPIIGVLVSRRTIANLNSQRTSNHMRLLRQANEVVKARLFFFAVSSVNSSIDKVVGTYWDAKAMRWKQQSFPLPNVLYVRGGGDQRILDALVNEVRKKGVVINYPPFDKWTVFQNLSRQDYMKDYLPETVLYRSEEDLKAMLAKYDEIYLKPSRGRKGRNVIRIRRDGKDFHLSFFVDWGPGRGLKQFNISGLESVVKYITSLYRGNLFLVQQAIDLVTYNEKLVDLRAEMVRNSAGQVEIIGVAARIGGYQSPITTHSMVTSLDYYLSAICNYSRTEIHAVKEKIREFLIAAYRHIELLTGRYGEIGIDFGIDKQGKLWFIECNSQSAKVSLAKAYGTEAVYKSFLAVLSYGVYAHRQRQRAKHIRHIAKAMDVKGSSVFLN